MTLQISDYLPLIKQALEEDLGSSGDITSQAIFSDEIGTAKILAKQSGILAGIEVAQAVFLEVTQNCRFNQFFNDRQLIQAMDVIIEIRGPVKQLLQAERTALNFLGRLSGIATLTHQFVEQIEHTNCRLLDTRKTTPGWRLLEKYAVTCGGGINHRFGLHDMVLIKDNHIAAAKGITPAVQKVKAYLASKDIHAKIEVEVTNLDELKETLLLNVDRIMLDNMPVAMMKQAVKFCDGKVELEASGNISLKSIRDVAETGVDFISVGALTHSVPNIDFSMRMV